MGCGAQVCQKPGVSLDELFMEFYRGTGQDKKGRTLEDILSWDDARLESGHNYIQWLFPSDQPSQFNNEAPHFSQALAEDFKNDPLIMANFFRSFSVFLRFLGLLYDEETKSVFRTEVFMKKAKNWLKASTTGPNHNWLRCSRVLHCLKLLGELEKRDAFYEALEQIYVDGLISERFKSTLKHWQDDGGIQRRPIPKQEASHTDLTGKLKVKHAHKKGLAVSA